MAHLTNFSFEFFYKIFAEDASQPLLYHGAKKSKMTKNSNQGGGGPALTFIRIWKRGVGFNPLSAKVSFQVWYPGGQRLKVISFSWAGVKPPSKCFSHTEPTTITASRDEKRCYAAVQWNQIGELKFVTLRWPTPEVSRMTASLRSPPRCSLTDLQLCVNVKENSEMQNGSDIGVSETGP